MAQLAGQLQLQLLDQEIAVGELTSGPVKITGHPGNDRLQRVYIIGKISQNRRHVRKLQVFVGRGNPLLSPP